MRALVFCNDPWHPASIVRRGLEPLLKNGIQFEFSEGDTLPPADLSGFSFVILARANLLASDQSKPWMTRDAEDRLPGYVRNGGGLLVIHAGTSRYEKLPQMNALIGGAFMSHPEPCAVTMEASAGHPVTSNVSAFTVCDEHYFVSINDARADVFMQSRSSEGIQPAGWTRVDGAGRVCVLTPGHDVGVWLHPVFQKLLFNAILWTANDP